jgi:putative ABC transport system permease protein
VTTFNAPRITSAWSGVVVLVLGGIGVWSVTRVFIRQKIRSVAILKCLGATTSQVLAAYVLQVLFLGAAGSVLGVGLARLGVAFIPPKVAAALGADAYSLTASAVAQGTAVGMLVSLLFSLVPLLEVRRVKPLLLLRGGSTAGLTGPSGYPGWWTIAGIRARLAAADWTQVAASLIVAGALVAIAGWQAASLRIGLIVCGGFAGVAFVLDLACSGIVRPVLPVARALWFPLRHAVLSLGRPGNQTRVILLAVGIGSFFVIGVRSLQANLLQQFSLELGTSGADMFLIEILPAQVDAVRAFLDAGKAPNAGPPRLIPVMRARVVGVEAARRTCSPSTTSAVRARLRASSRLPAGIISRRTRRSLTARSGTTKRRFPRTHRSVRCRSRRASTSARRSTSATSCASTSSGGLSRRA